MRSFHKADWTNFYGNVSEAVPNNAPEPRGKEIELHVINMACVMWHTKCQATVESAVFGAEFIVMKQAMEASCGLQYKLHMMGILIIGLMCSYGDNMSMIHNTQCPESTLKKKSNSICYHAIREAIAMGEILTGHVKMDKNPADLLTKVVLGGIKR